MITILVTAVAVSMFFNLMQFIFSMSDKFIIENLETLNEDLKLDNEYLQKMKDELDFANERILQFSAEKNLLKEQRDAFAQKNEKLEERVDDLLHQNANMDLKLNRWAFQPRNEKGQFIKMIQK